MSDEALRAAALRLLDAVTPCVSALEIDHPKDDADTLYGDLAEALGLPRDYGSDAYAQRVADGSGS